MIPTSELRIGNWVTGIDAEYNIGSVSGPFQVRSIDAEDDRINTWRVPGFSDESARDVSPIILTPEILEQCGFAKMRGKYSIGRVGLSDYGNGFYGFSWDGWDDLPGRPCAEFQYLHQLQNLLYALTGEELTYTPLIKTTQHDPSK